MPLVRGAGIGVRGELDAKGLGPVQDDMVESKLSRIRSVTANFISAFRLIESPNGDINCEILMGESDSVS